MSRRLARCALALLLAACGGTEAREPGARASASLVRRPADVRPTPPLPPRLALGRAPAAALVRAWDIDVDADGHGLPPGRGTYAEGKALFAARCASCHGAAGEGLGSGPGAYPRLVGREPRDGFPFGNDVKQVKTVGNYWPYATTLFDYVRRAMPFTAPGTLTDDETYALVAYLLAENEVVGRGAVMDARALREVRMPARDRFVPDDRRGGPTFR